MPYIHPLCVYVVIGFVFYVDREGISRKQKERLVWKHPAASCGLVPLLVAKHATAAPWLQNKLPAQVLAEFFFFFFPACGLRNETQRQRRGVRWCRWIWVLSRDEILVLLKSRSASRCRLQKQLIAGWSDCPHLGLASKSKRVPGHLAIV